MIEIKEKALCTGCSACSSVCSKSSISMQEDDEGFDYPIVDAVTCINCHLCEKICPVTLPQPKSEATYTICIQNKDERVRSRSSAGGVIGAVYQAVFQLGGIVYGVGFDEGNMVRFMKAETLEECFRLKLFTSKYVPAELDNVLSKVKADLDTERIVCFVGLPCQVAGLHSFLRHEYENLWLIDLTCYGVPSRKLYREYLEYLENTYHEKITDVRFRDKSFGYMAQTMSVELKSGKVKSQNCAVKSYLRCFFKDIASRPSCYECHFKTVDRVSDITVGDMKSIYKFVQSMDDDLGTTVLYVHSEKGKKILDAIDDQVRFAEVPLEGVLNTSGKKMVSCPKQNPERVAFFSEIDNLSYEMLVKKYCPPDISEYIASMIKGVLKVTGLNRTGVLKAIKRRKDCLNDK